MGTDDILMVRLGAVERELRGLRGDLNDGLERLLAALERLTEKIDAIAAIRPRVDDLEHRVAVLEAQPR
jgi:hypothetical protein